VAFPSCAANGSERKIAVLLVAFFIQPDVHSQMSRYIYVSEMDVWRRRKWPHMLIKVAISFHLVVQLMRHLYAVNMHLTATRDRPTRDSLCATL
jgi:hypothetical protein